MPKILHKKRVKIIYIVLTLFFVLFLPLKSQSKYNNIINKSVRGFVFDQSSGITIPGVIIKFISGKDTSYIISDEKGSFYTNLPIGMYNIIAEAIGFEPSIIENKYIGTGKETNFDIYLLPKTEELETVNISALKNKEKPINIKAQISARSFTLTEANKFAGCYGDPARMAANYSGVLSAGDNRNDIIVRGNSSSSLKWYIEGVEVPNPNHFAATGTTGGPLTIMNTNLLNNSDFITGIFPVEYRNTVSGVFDIKLRPGNSEVRENWVQTGFNGLEFGTEGPINKKKNSSYIVAYRYSLVDIISFLGVDLDETAKYQDLNLKLNFPQTKIGSFSFFTIAGLSNIKIYDSRKNKPTFNSHGEDINSGYKMASSGITHKLFTSNNFKIENIISFNYSNTFNDIDSFSIYNKIPTDWGNEYSEKNSLNYSISIDKEISKKLNYTIGGNLNISNHNYADSQLIQQNFKVFTNTKNYITKDYYAYSDILYRPSSKYSIYAGIAYDYFSLSKEGLFKPSLSIIFKPFIKHQISIGGGLYSTHQPDLTYFILNDSSSNYSTNIKLKSTKTLQFGSSWDYFYSETMRIKTELYYQYLYDIPLSTKIPEYSLINFGAEYYIERVNNLVNKGKGENYGIDLTLEKFFNKKYMFLITSSIFESNYTDLNKVKRSTGFNGNYSFNFVFNYAKNFPKVHTTMNYGFNGTYSGGRPYVPYNTAESVKQGTVIYDWENAYTVRRPDYKRFSLRFSIKRDKQKYSTETTLDLMYRTNYLSIYYDRLDIENGEIVKTFKMGFYPMINWKLSF